MILSIPMWNMQADFKLRASGLMYLIKYRLCYFQEIRRLTRIHMILVSIVSLVGTACPGQEQQMTQVIAFGNIEINAKNVDKISTGVALHCKVNHDNLTLLFIGGFTNKEGAIDHSALNQLKLLTPNIHLIPGDHEWQALGPEGIRKLDDDLEGEVDQDFVIPDNGCGEIETKSLGDDIELLAFDSEWLLREWSDQTSLNKGCIVKNRERFYFHLADEFGSAKEKTILLLCYHPPFRFDHKSGHKTLKDHLFPLSEWNDNLLIPLPYVGTLMTQSQAYLQNSEYSTHPRYREFSKAIYRQARSQKKTIIISADADQSNAIFLKDGLYLNVNSSNKQQKPVVKFDGSFSTQPAGMSIMMSFDSVHYWAYDLQQPHLAPLFSGSKVIPVIIADEIRPDSFALKNYGNSTTAPIYTEQNLIELGSDVLTGSLNTALYTLPVNVSVMDLEKLRLDPIKIGGGNQTVSVRLQDEHGKEFVIRSLRKNPEQLLPKFLRIEPTKELLRYFFTSANPFSFLTLYELEKQAGLLHSEPSLCFIPYQNRLAPYNDEIGEQLVLFSDRLDGDRSDSPSLLNSPELISTDDMVEEFLDNDIDIAADYFLQNRLLDLITGDWDRHEDQWRWAKEPHTDMGLPLYYPVARDRDQALSNFDGLFLSLARHYNPSIRPMRPFDDKISKRDVRWQSIGAHYLDQLLLTQIDQSEWQAITQQFAKRFDDESIEHAISVLPDTISEKNRKELVRILKSRFNQIDDVSNTFYKEVNDNIFIMASEKPDSIFLNTTASGHLHVKILSETDDEKYIVKYSKTISPQSTKTVHIYGLEGNDVFSLNINKSKPRVFLIGGFGDDHYERSETSRSSAKVLEFIDTDTDEIGSGIPTNFLSNRNLESFTRYDLLPTYMNIAPIVRADKDDQFYLGLTAHWYITKFKKNIHHYLGGSFATRRSSTAFLYGMESSNRLKRRSFFLELNADGPRYNFNFYGLGNESKLNVDLDREFYFVRRQLLQAEAGWRWKIGEFGNIGTSLYANRIEIDTSVSNRFINDNIPQASANGPNAFAGGHVNISFENINSTWVPTDGIRINANLRLNKGIDNNQDHLKGSVRFDMYKSLDYKKCFIYSTQIKYQSLIGDYYFYHAPAIGGNENLRGWRADRFRGRSALSQNHNVHVKLVDRKRKNWIPVSVGVTGSFDYGRVWQDDDNFRGWHSSWGAGIWLSPMNAFIFSASVHQGKETTEIRATLGWQL